MWFNIHHQMILPSLVTLPVFTISVAFTTCLLMVKHLSCHWHTRLSHPPLIQSLSRENQLKVNSELVWNYSKMTDSRRKTLTRVSRSHWDLRNVCMSK